MKIELLEYSENALSLIYAACRQCYSPKSAAGIFASGKDHGKNREGFVKQVVSSGHESPLEHVKFTFAVEGVSRALTHQLVRHRIASYSQQSQRYVQEEDFDYIVPPSIAEDADMTRVYTETMTTIQSAYDRLIDGFRERGLKGEIANQDARFILPQAAETKIVVTMNCRELLHFFKQRCCSRAQWEIRALARKMLDLCREKLPAVFEDAGAKCVALGYCPEGERFTCGRYPLKQDMLGRNHAATESKH